MAESIETRHENWLRVVWGLLHVREGLQEYVDTKGKQHYKVLKNNVMGKCNNQTCNRCQVNKKCQNGVTKKTGKSQFRSGHFCDEMNREVQNNHESKNPMWVNTDSTKWEDPHVGHWEVTKCYLSTSGYLDKTGPNHVDASGLLSICINSSFIKQFISNIQHFIEVRNIRNKTLHDAHYEFDRQTAEECLDKMIAVLQDPQELLHNASAKKAADNIRDIKERSAKIPVFMSEALEQWLLTNFDVESALRETEKRMFERLRKELKEELKHHIHEEIGLKHKLADSNEEKIKRRRIEDQEAKLKVLKTKLIRNILENNSALQLNPIVQHQDSMLVDFYEPPHMSKTVLETENNDSKTRIPVDKSKTGRKSDIKHKKVQKSLSKIEELFISNQSNDNKNPSYINRVYISGEAGMGKTSFSQYLALAWCAVHGESEECVRMRKKMKMFKFFNDIEYLTETQLLFLLHLREFDNESDCKKMLKTYLQSDLGYSDGDINDLLSHINSPETVLLMDGLDEWKCTANKMPKYTSVSEARIICTSRPWKIDSCVKARMLDYNKITINGIGFDFVERLVRNVTECLRQEGIDVRDDTMDFIQTLHSTELKTIIYLNASALDEALLLKPVVILQLLCLWHDGKDFGRTRTQVYMNMYETLLRRMKKKHGKQYVNTTDKSQLQVYTTMGVECCFQHSENIAKLSTLAFYLLFTGPKEHSLQFSKIENQEIEDTFKGIKQFCLHSGIIQGTARKSSSSLEKIYSFIHKTYQELLAALHIVARKCDANICQEIVANTKTLQDVIELANVFDFVCGTDSTCIEAMVSLIDDLTTKHAIITDDEMRIRLIQTIQNMIFDSCSKNVNEGKVSINLSNLIVNDSHWQNHQVFPGRELKKLLRTNEYKFESHHLEITLNKKLGVLYLYDLTLTNNMDVSQFDMEELIMLFVSTECVNLSKIQRLKRIKLVLQKPTSLSVSFQYAENLTYLELRNCSLLGQLDLSQCPLKVLKMENTSWSGPWKLSRCTMNTLETINVIMEKITIGSIEKVMYFLIDFKHFNKLIYLTLSNLSVPDPMDISQCPLKCLNLSNVVTERVIVGCVEKCTLMAMSCLIEFTNVSKIIDLNIDSCSLQGPLDLSQWPLESLKLYEVATERVIVGCVEKCTLRDMSCLIELTNVSKLTELDLSSCSLPGPLDLSQCSLKRLDLMAVNTERVIVGCVETSTLEDMSCSIDFANANKLTNLDMLSCSLPGHLDLSHCQLECLLLSKVDTERVIIGCVEECTLDYISCLIEFTNVSKLTYLDMSSCSLPGPLDLSQCPLKQLELSKVDTDRVIVGCVEECTLQYMSCLIDFTNVSKLTDLDISSCSLTGPLDLSQCPLKRLALSKVVTERVIVACEEKCTLEYMSCLIEFTNHSKLTDLVMSSCSLPGPLDLSQCPLKRLELNTVATDRLIVGCEEKCTLRDMSCLIEFKNVSKLTTLDMWSCSLPGPLDLSQCPLGCLDLFEIDTERVNVGCVEKCVLSCMSCLFEFTNTSKLTDLDMSVCSLPGPLNLSQCHLKRLELSNVETERVIVGCVEKCTLRFMSCFIEFTDVSKLTDLEMRSCSLPVPLDISQWPLEGLELSNVDTERVVVGCVEKCTLRNMSCLLVFTNVSKLTDLDMSSCSLPGPLNLLQCPLKRLVLSKVDTERVIVGCVETSTLEDMSCSIEFTNVSKLTDLNMCSCSLPVALDLSQWPLEGLQLHAVDTERVIVGCVEKCTLRDMSCLIEFTDAIKLTNLDMSSCSLPGPLDLSQCPLKRLELSRVVTKWVIFGCVEKCTLRDMSCLIEFSNANKLTDLDMSSCSLPGPLNLSQCHLRRLELLKVVTERVIVGCVERCTLRYISCLIEFTNVSNLTYLNMWYCSFQGNLNLSQWPLEDLQLYKVDTERVIVGCVKECTLQDMSCIIEFTNLSKLTVLDMWSCSLQGPLDLSQCHLKRLQLSKVITRGVMIGCLEKCSLQCMLCLIEFTNHSKLSDLDMLSCSLPGPLDLSQCQLKRLALSKVIAERVIVGCVETCSLKDVIFFIEFTNLSKLTDLDMSSCFLPGPLDLSQCPLQRLVLYKVDTERVCVGCLKKCTLKCMSCLIEFKRTRKSTDLDMSSCSLPGPLDLSQRPIKRLELSNVETERVIIGCAETCTFKDMNFLIEFTNISKLTDLDMSSCSLTGPLNLSQCPLKRLRLSNVDTEKVILCCVKECTLQGMSCLIEFTNVSKLTDLDISLCSCTTLVCMPFANAHTLKNLKMTNCSHSDSIDLSECPLDELHLKDVKTDMVIVGSVRTCIFKNMSCSFMLKIENTLIDLRFHDCVLTEAVNISNCPLQFLALVRVDLSQFKLGPLKNLTKLCISDCRFLSALPSSASKLVHVILEHCEVQQGIHYQPLTTLEIKETCGLKSYIELSQTSIEHLILNETKIFPSVFEEQMGHLCNLPHQVECTVRGSLSYWQETDEGIKLMEAIEKMKNDDRFYVDNDIISSHIMTTRIFTKH